MTTDIDLETRILELENTNQQLIDQNDKFRQELARLYGLERPFICGNTGTIDDDGLPTFVLVCPAYGADGFALYKKFKDYTAPGY
jgi:hypothetical protein